MKKARTIYDIKNLWVGAVIIVMIYLCWKLAIQPTIEEYQCLNEVKKNIALLEDATAKREILLKSIENDSSLTFSSTYNTDPRQILLKQVSILCTDTHVDLIRFEEPSINQEAGLKTLVYRLTFKGDFIKLVRLVSNLENKYQPGKVVSVRFYTIEDLLKNKKELFMETWIRNVTTQNNRNETTQKNS